MAGRRELRPAFKRVLGCFESYSEFARQLGEVHRQGVGYWLKIGYIPGKHARKVSLATAGEVSIIELLNEADREEARRAAEREMAKRLKAEKAAGVMG